MDVDLVIRNGTIVDGMGGEPFAGDVAVKDGRIAGVGPALAVRATEEIDATGQIVTPGFVDMHTHYDGQVTWDHRLWPSSLHGVTTVMMGNCGVGFAPCRPQDREKLVHLMEGVEDLPEIVLTEGLPWNWETFPEYLDFLDGRSFDIDVAALAPHSAFRIYVMGDRASDREMATADDRARMATLVGEAIEAGALGFGTSRTISHKSSDGSLVPTLRAAEAELAEIGGALAQLGRGIIQVSDFQNAEEELPRLRRIAEQTGRPVSLTVLLKHHTDQWDTALQWVEDCIAAGLDVQAQVSGRPIGALLGFELSRNPFWQSPTFKQLKALPREERLAALRQADVRARIISEPLDHDESVGGDLVRRWAGMYPLGDPPNYEPTPDDSIAAIAARSGVAPEELAYDTMLEQDGEGVLIVPTSGLVGGNLDTAGNVLQRPYTVQALGDGGAHVGILCDASYPSFLLQYWGRERRSGSGTIPLAALVRCLSWETAQSVGLGDRGALRPGLRADINVIDFDKLQLGAPRVQRDLPAGGARVLQRASGYTATIVGGQVTYRDGVPTGALPGRLVRGARPKPAS